MNRYDGSMFIYLFIYIASRWGHLDTVRLLIEKGANVNEKDTSGNTALILGRQ